MRCFVAFTFSFHFSALHCVEDMDNKIEKCILASCRYNNTQHGILAIITYFGNFTAPDEFGHFKVKGKLSLGKSIFYEGV
jgi:hypothetical protein